MAPRRKTQNSDGRMFLALIAIAIFGFMAACTQSMQSQSNTTEPVPFADFSTLDEDDSEDAFSTVTFP